MCFTMAFRGENIVEFIQNLASAVRALVHIQVLVILSIGQGDGALWALAPRPEREQHGLMGMLSALDAWKVLNT